MFGCFRMFLGFRDFKSLGLRFRLQGSSSFGFRVVRQFCSFLQMGLRVASKAISTLTGVRSISIYACLAYNSSY